MCGRYVSTRSPRDLADVFHTAEPPASADAPGPSWNVAPTDEVWSVLERADRGTGEVTRRLRPLRWGLVPSWAKDVTVGARMINARMETVGEKPAFRRAFVKRRCLLPADGFYEWQGMPAREDRKPYKQPYLISPADGSLMAFAGLYEFWRDPQVAEDDDPRAWLASCTIITTEATDAAGRVHPRMPLAIAAGDWDAWLDPARQDPEELRELLTPPAGGRLDAQAVTTAVNNVRNNGPELLTAVDVEPFRGA
ncbi:SOS response-associated peptidase [Streptomyces sp. ICBB 8177]|uniref:SOS response-associated peptidase n=1 Tax=Streptomyces sp. ICBB 8177 TaxID=563922 RepID=UPI000D6770C4|nr:SOS response-associated peptidase [Streptomyces sp. ICBB 8177]PWI44840.1 DUF159 family protein [Streptomyces sp. ICBB 8177]